MSDLLDACQRRHASAFPLSPSLKEVLHFYAKPHSKAPFCPKIEFCGQNPLYHSYLTALLLKKAGLEKQAEALASRLHLLKRFETLWCQEAQFERGFFQDIRSEFESVFLNLEAMDISSLVEVGQSEMLEGALTFLGNHSPLGCLNTPHFSVPAFGPQSKNLSEPQFFGIRGILPKASWAQVVSSPNCWVSAKSTFEEYRWCLEASFIGMNIKEPLFFSFYLRASQLTLGKEIYTPQSLKHYQGEVREIFLDPGWKFSVEGVKSMQLIPLSGEEGFWNSHFLLSFEIRPITNCSKAIFEIKNLFEIT